MIRSDPSQLRARAAAAALLLLLAGGVLGCSKRSKAAPTAAAPADLSYAPDTVNGFVNLAVTLTPTVTGTVTSYSVTPTLPAGLSLDPTTGLITGAPTATSAEATYTITATNAGGPASATVQIQINPTVYVAGFLETADGGQALTTWTNAAASQVTNGGGIEGGGAMTVSGADMYLVSNLMATPTSQNVGCLWENGQQLTFPGNAACLEGIAVAGTDVYVVGYTIGSQGPVATLWTNGNPAQLDASLSQSNATAITLAGGNVYVAGQVGDVPTCWVNGTAHTLPLPAGISLNWIYSILASGTDLYIAGNTVQNTTSALTATVWQNATAQFLPGGTIACALAANASGVYAAGSSALQAMLWTLPSGGTSWTAATLGGDATSPGLANGVALGGSAIYVAGSVGNAVTVWENGNPTAWTTGALPAQVTGLFVAGD